MFEYFVKINFFVEIMMSVYVNKVFFIFFELYIWGWFSLYFEYLIIFMMLLLF